MCKNEYEVKMQAMDLMSAAINDVVCAMDAIDKFAEAFGLCEDQEAEREKDLNRSFLKNRLSQAAPLEPPGTFSGPLQGIHPARPGVFFFYSTEPAVLPAGSPYLLSYS